MAVDDELNKVLAVIRDATELKQEVDTLRTQFIGLWADYDDARLNLIEHHDPNEEADTEELDDAWQAFLWTISDVLDSLRKRREWLEEEIWNAQGHL